MADHRNPSWRSSFTDYVRSLIYRQLTPNLTPCFRPKILGLHTFIDQLIGQLDRTMHPYHMAAGVKPPMTRRMTRMRILGNRELREKWAEGRSRLSLFQNASFGLPTQHDDVGSQGFLFTCY
jgi:hypothetical protein